MLHHRLLAEVPVFQGVEEAWLDRLAALATPVGLVSEQLVFSHGDEADAVYLVTRGSVALFRDAVGQPMQLLAHVGPGDYFGEMCLFDEHRRSATARARETSVVLRFDKHDFAHLLGEQPRLLLRLQVAAAQRHHLNAAAALALGRRAEVRIRLAAPCRLLVTGGSPRPIVLENLSVGGLCLTGGPADWQPEDRVDATIAAGEVTLPVRGRVAWRRGDTLGVAFEPRPVDHDARVYRLLRELAG